MDVPDDLGDLDYKALRALDHSIELVLKAEIVRVSRKEPNFRRALKQALRIEAELERRGLST